MKRQNIATEKGSNISYKNSAAGKLRVKIFCRFFEWGF